MFFTQDDYRKIQEWLQRNSVKDTEFQEADIPLNGNEVITLVQNGHNKKVHLEDLVKQMFSIGITDFVNVSSLHDKYNITLNEAIQLVPHKSRKKGQVITFCNTDNVWKIYQFTGVKNQWNILDLWNDLFDWTTILDVNFGPDEEDITANKSEDNIKLSFKDRVYEPDSHSGLGYKILRKNIVTYNDPTQGELTKNILVQDKVSQSNTIYEIRYDFDLNNQTINIPENSVLQYKGGSLNNGKIVYNNTIIEGIERLNNVTTEGDYTYPYTGDESNPDEQLAPTLAQVRKLSTEVTNIADDEDLTKIYDSEKGQEVLQLKDRQYVQGSNSGMGYVILRQNKSFKEQVTKANTIYEIRYDFDLDGETVEIPENCMLEFQGGSLINGVIVFNNTKLYGFPKIYCNYSGSIKGDINVLWFGVDNEGVKGVSDVLQTIIDTFDNKTIYFPTGNYIIDKQVRLPKSIAFAGNGDDSVLELRYNGYNFLLGNFNNENNYAVTIKMRNLRIIGTYPSWYDADADSKKTECSFLHVKATAYTYYSLFEDINVSNVKFGITIDKCYWSRFSNVRFYDYEIGLDLAEANSSSISGCTFRGGFDRGLIFRRSHNEPSAGIGVSIQDNDFSGNNYCGMQILGQFTSSSITGNYFESEPGYQIIVGGKDAEQYNTPISLTGSLIKGNGGLWADGKKGIRVYGQFSRNDCDAAVYFEEGSSGRYNTGWNEVSKSKQYYNEMWTYDIKYRQGILDYWDSQIKHDIIENICIPANSEITIDSFAFRFFKFLYFKSLIEGVTLVMYAIGDPNQYIVGTEEKGQANMEDETPFWKGDLLDIGTLKNCMMKLRNTTDKNVVTNIEVKYFYNMYGK